MKKKDKSVSFLKRNFYKFRCPICHGKFEKPMTSAFVCENHHHYDVSKKGTLYFLKHHVQTEYNKEMLSHRQAMIKTGMYDELLQNIYQQLSIENIETVVDIGCGEGSFLNKLDDFGMRGEKIGFDISKEGILMATEQKMNGFWCIADVTNLPFADSSVSHLLNIFSPSHYEEFKRVLQSDGKIIKVIPESNYLKEIREIFYEDNEERQTYSNEKVVKKFSKEMKLEHIERVTYQFPVTESNKVHLLKMSPLHWGASREGKMKALEASINFITVDVLILIGKK